jgi:hypothetical protein
MFRYYVKTPLGKRLIESCSRDRCSCIDRLNYPVITVYDYELYQRCKTKFHFPECVKTTTQRYPPTEETKKNGH